MLFDLLHTNIGFHIRYHKHSIGYEATIFLNTLAQTLSSPVAGLAARPPALAASLFPHHLLPVVGGRPGGFVPAPRPGRRHQPGPKPGPIECQLLLPAALFSLPGTGSGPFDPTLAADSPV